MGGTAKNIRIKCAQAKAEDYCVLFFDEIDVIGGKPSGNGGTSDERTTTVTQLFTAIDQLTENSNVIVIGATNYDKKLDSRLLRRFGSSIKIDVPNELGRQAIFKLYIERLPKVASNVKAQNFYQELAKKTDNWSGSFIKLLVEQATRLAVKDGVVKKEHFNKAFQSIANQQKQSWYSYQNQLENIAKKR